GRPVDLWRSWKRSRSRRRARRSCSVLMHRSPSPAQRGRVGEGGTPIRSNARSLLLPFLPPDLLGGVANALALVRLRPAECADLSRHLADQPLVHAFHLDRGWTLAGDLDPLRDRIDDRMRI